MLVQLEHQAMVERMQMTKMVLGGRNTISCHFDLGWGHNGLRPDHWHWRKGSFFRNIDPGGSVLKTIGQFTGIN